MPEETKPRATITMNTINHGFNDAWTYLADFFPTANLPNGESLDLTKKPQVLSMNWPYFAAAIVTVLTIGLRNSWLDLHQDYSGNPILFYVRKEVADGN